MAGYGLPSWQSYPQIGESPIPCTRDIEHLKRLLEEHAPLTFVGDSSQIQMEVFEQDSDAEQSSSSIITSESSLQQIFARQRRGCNSLAFILSQAGTWSRLRISLNMFRMICTFNAVVPSFIEIAIAFGFKLSDEDEYFVSCYRQIHRSVGSGSRADLNGLDTYEIYYNIRFIELHGRMIPTDPWSFRQSAIYHKFDFKSRSSTWILLQPSQNARRYLETTNMNEYDGILAPIAFHILMLTSSSHSWRWYLNYLSEALDDLRDRVLCCTELKHDSGLNDVSFQHTQSLELIQAKARRTLSIIESMISVEHEVRCHIEELASYDQAFNQCIQWKVKSMISNLSQHIHELEVQKRKARDIIETSIGVGLLIARILELRNQDTVNVGNASLRQLALSGVSENRLMILLTESAQKDSRIMKVASVIALTYLPAGLVASIFSTDLVHLLTAGTHFSRSVGIYLALVGLLTGGTFLLAFLWIRKDKKRLIGMARPSVTP